MEYGNEKKYPSDPQHRRESEILPEAPRPFPEAAGRPAADQRLRYHGDHAGPHRDGLPLHFHF